MLCMEGERESVCKILSKKCRGCVKKITERVELYSEHMYIKGESPVGKTVTFYIFYTNKLIGRLSKLLLWLRPAVSALPANPCFGVK